MMTGAVLLDHLVNQRFKQALPTLQSVPGVVERWAVTLADGTVDEIGGQDFDVATKEHSAIINAEIRARKKWRG